MVIERENLLGPDDAEPVLLLNAQGRSPFLLTGDHAGRAIPQALGTMGLGPDDLSRHIAWDIGVRALGERLSAALDAPFIHQAHSRLVIDCNRDPSSEEAIPSRVDGSHIPANQDLSQAQKNARIDEIHQVYHAAIAQEIARRDALSIPTIVIALHSFTPKLGQQVRPWDIGILHDGANDIFARALLRILQSDGSLIVGDNEPYHMDATDYSIPHHAFARQLPYAEIEVRQDLIADEAGQSRWATILADALARAAQTHND